ncbi:uncharacterized protein LOC144468072 [Augochlora pura]
MKLSVLLGVLCFAAVAVMSASAEETEVNEKFDVNESVDVDSAPVDVDSASVELDSAPVEPESAPAVQPLISCQLCGNACCSAHCIMMGKSGGRCRKNTCVCRN